MGIFGKNNQAGASEAIKRDERKARRFFEHARAVAETRNYDYAVECYINGLRHDPDNMTQHEALREVSLKRKVAGGRPANLGDRLKKGGRTALDRMLHAEMLWAKDPLNVSHMIDVMARAADLTGIDPDLHMSEVVYWVGTLVLEANQTSKKPSKAVYLKARDLFAKIEAFDKAVQACSMAIQLDSQDSDLLQSLKDLEAERTIQEGGYSDSYRASIRDEDKQRELDQGDAITKPQSAIDQAIERTRTAFEEDPQDRDKMKKLVDALVQKETDAAEDEAIELLEEAWADDGQYRWKVRIGDIKMKRFNRRLRELNKVLKKDPNDEQTKDQWREIAKQKLRFELEEYSERVQNYPTDLGLRYELGKRLSAYSRHDEAIAAFQMAKSDPRYRAAAHEYLGRCYMAQEWYEEAVDTLKQGMEAHPIDDDKLGKDLRYRLMLALKQSAEKNRSLDDALEAQKTASGLLQTDIKYRDIRQQIEEIRKLVGQLKNPAA